MLHNIIVWIYCIPLWVGWFFLFVSPVIWGLICYALSNKVSSRSLWIINLILFITATILLFYITIFSRTQSSERELVLVPFHTINEAICVQPELWRTLFMNILLFVPLGMTLPFVVMKKHVITLPFSICVGAFISIIIEMCQYSMSLGQSDIDDVIMNIIGIVIGYLAYVTVSLIKSLIGSKR